MNSQSFLQKISEIRDNSECDPGENVDFTFKHGKLNKDSGKIELYRHYTASILLYPTNNKHYEIISDIVLNKRYNYGIIIHNHDLKDNPVSKDSDDDDENDFNDFEDLVDDDENKISFKKTHCHLIIQYANTRTNTAL